MMDRPVTVRRIRWFRSRIGRSLPIRNQFNPPILATANHAAMLKEVDKPDGSDDAAGAIPYDRGRWVQPWIEARPSQPKHLTARQGDPYQPTGPFARVASDPKGTARQREG